jgi:hypothetical protein
METVGLLKLLNFVEQEHHLNLLVQQVVEPIALGELVKFHLELVGNNIGQELVLERTAPHLPKQILEFVAIHFVALGVLGQQLMELDLELVKDQTAQLIQKQSDDVHQAAQPLADLAAEQDQLHKLVQRQPGPLTAK